MKMSFGIGTGGFSWFELCMFNKSCRFLLMHNTGVLQEIGEALDSCVDQCGLSVGQALLRLVFF